MRSHGRFHWRRHRNVRLGRGTAKSFQHSVERLRTQFHDGMQHWARSKCPRSWNTRRPDQRACLFDNQSRTHGYCDAKYVRQNSNGSSSKSMGQRIRMEWSVEWSVARVAFYSRSRESRDRPEFRCGRWILDVIPRLDETLRSRRTMQFEPGFVEWGTSERRQKEMGNVRVWRRMDSRYAFIELNDRIWIYKDIFGIRSEGVTAGGCRNYLETFWHNPQYVVSLADPDEDDDDGLCTIIVALMQKNRRSRRNMGMDCLTIGFAIYRVTERDLMSKPLKQNFFKYNASVARSPAFINLREVRTHYPCCAPYCLKWSAKCNHSYKLYQILGQLPVQVAARTISYRSVHIRTERGGWILNSCLLRAQKSHGVC